jgi:hypothetical protein
MKSTILATAILECAAVAAPIARVAAATAISSPSASAASAQSAEAFLHSIYNGYIGEHSNAPDLDYTKERELRRYFESSLAKIIANDSARAAKNSDEGTLEADPFIDAQDWEIKSFDIQVTPIDADHANALVKFDNAGAAELIHLQLIRISGAWKIHDIDYGGQQRTLRGLFQDGGS